MSLPDPENTRIDHAIEDSGIHVRDSERATATLWQMLITALLVVAILTVFFYGVTEQREEVAGVTPAPRSESSVPPAQAEPPKGSATTGQSTK
jgi:hypothetical protein